MARLGLFLLGPPRVERDGEPVEIGRRKAIALLAHLAVTGPSTDHSRDALATLLWPEYDQSRARAGLRRTLSALRKALQQAHDAAPTEDWLDVDRERVGLKPDAEIWLDVKEFQDRLVACRTHDHPEQEVCSDCLPLLTEAVELYRDDFLAGFTLRDSPGFDEWQFFQTETLRDQLASALERLIIGHGRSGEFELAIAYARRYLALDPVHEPAHRHLMRLYAQSDRRAAALRQYEECERVLEAEMGVPPEEETAQLYQAIVENRDLRLQESVSAQPSALDVRYRLEAEVGRGGMGVVYRAHDTLLDRTVAVKVVDKAALGTGGRARLLNEARAAAKLNHPNIVSIYDAGEAGPSVGSGQAPPFIVMELVEGESLHIRRPEILVDILAIARQVCAALEHAHKHGIVHRDLKPENVIITADGTAKLTDFGLARSVASRITGEGALVGTVFYLAPELALGQEFDGRADLYALGVMLYELTTGRLPFSADDPVAVISQHLHAPVVPPRARNAEIPFALDDLILRLLSKDPAARPSSASEVLHILNAPDILDKDAAPKEELSVLERIERGRMVGRERELADARTLWNGALLGQGQILLVSGEPGIGKTRLVRELVTHVQVSGGRALVGASYAEGGAPYAAFRQILCQALGDGSEDGFDLPETVLAELLTLTPEMRHRYPDIPPNPSLDPQAEQQRLFDSLLILVTALSDHAPLLLVLEDTHWADSGTVSLMRHLARHTRQGRMMIVATYREVELDQARPLHEVLLDLSRERLATRLKLTRLGREQTKEMLAILFSEEITPEFLDGIYRETEGNPFFIEEVVKALVESGKMSYKEGRWDRPSMPELGIPQSVRVAIQSRVGVLRGDAEETLRLAAVLGREFDYRTLAAAARDKPEDALIDALESAEQAQLIEELTREGGGTFAFVHGLIPSTLVESTRTLQRRRLHRRAAAAIEMLRPDDYEALAYHYHQAGEIEKATNYLLKAGDRARTLYAHQEAIDHYREALAFLKETGAYRRAARTLMKLGLTYHTAFDFQRARQAYEEGFVLWQRAVEMEPAISPPTAPHAFREGWLDPPTLDPALAEDSLSGATIVQLFSGLVELSPELNVVPGAARSWEVSEGGRKYLFRLQDHLRWSDEVPLTAEDFEYAWKRVLDPDTGSPVARLLYDIKGARAFHRGEVGWGEVGVRALDELSLAVELEGPTGYFLHLLAHYTTYPVPRHVVDAQGGAWTEPGNFTSNGPFRLETWDRGESMVLARNPAYAGRFRGNLDRVELPLLEDPSAALEMYEADDLDIVYLPILPAVEMDRIRQRHAGEYVSGPTLNTEYVGFDASQSPFDDPRVRRAFVLATDQETLADVVLGGYVSPALGGFIPPGMPGHSSGIALPYDPDRARQLLAEAGYPGGRGFPVRELPIRRGHESVDEYLQAQWRENLGLEISWVQMEWRSFLDHLFRETPRMWCVAWAADYPDPDNFLRAGSWRSYTGWQNEAFDRLVDDARRVMNQGERIKMYQEADRILVEEAVIMPLSHGRFHLLVKPWVKRYPASVIGGPFWNEIVIEPH